MGWETHTITPIWPVPENRKKKKERSQTMPVIALIVPKLINKRIMKLLGCGELKSKEDFNTARLFII